MTRPEREATDFKAQDSGGDIEIGTGLSGEFASRMHRTPRDAFRSEW
jgi:hypothetical protein